VSTPPAVAPTVALLRRAAAIARAHAGTSPAYTAGILTATVDVLAVTADTIEAVTGPGEWRTEEACLTYLDQYAERRHAPVLALARAILQETT